GAQISECQARVENAQTASNRISGNDGIRMERRVTSSAVTPGFSCWETWMAKCSKRLERALGFCHWCTPFTLNRLSRVQILAAALLPNFGSLRMRASGQLPGWDPLSWRCRGPFDQRRSNSPLQKFIVLLIAAVLAVLVSLAYATPSDPTWIAGV